MRRSALLLLVILLLVASPSMPASPPNSSDRPFPLLAGDPAPALAVSAWIKGDPVPRFEPGRVYLLDFWATWCGPCVAGFPHLSEIQARHRDRVTVIAVNVLEMQPQLVPAFVEKQGERMAFAVATDSIPAGKEAMAGLAFTGWLYDSGTDAIPAEFIVDGGGRVAWIGFSSEADSVLEAVIVGTWDTDAFAAAYRERKVKEAPGFRFRRELDAAQEDQEWPRIWSLSEGYSAADSVSERRENLHAVWSALGVAAATILEGNETVPVDLEWARRFAERADSLRAGNPWALSVRARVEARAGHAEIAAALLRRAIELSPEAWKPRYQKLLERVEAGERP